MRIRIFLFGLLLFSRYLYASHNLAGQITAAYQSPNTYELTLTMFSDPSQLGTDRCSATLEIWSATGNKIGEIVDIPRSNGALVTNQPNCSLNNAHIGETVYASVKRNIYIASYTFPGPGKYLIRYYDPYRRADIVNIANPGNVNFYVETELFITNPVSGKNNSTPVLLNDPLDKACIGKIWTHNPGGYDADGDSLVYQLSPSLEYDPVSGPFSPVAASGYQFPDNSSFGVSSLTMNPQTGLMTWLTPQMVGTYNIAYYVYEYRNGVQIGHVLRDMVIIVQNCLNDPPQILTIQDTCIKAGTSLIFPFKAWDPNPIDSIYLQLNTAGSGLNGPFAVSNPATIQLFNPVGNQLPAALLNDTIKGQITWNTICENIRSVPYQVDLNAHDNFSYYNTPGTAMMSDNKIVTIRVIPPAPTTLTAVKNNGSVTLNWLASACPNVAGYRIYRKVGNQAFLQDSICCDVKPSAAGFTLLQYQQGTSTTFQDDLSGLTNLPAGDLCYVVTAMYGSPSNPKIESCATNLACVSFFSSEIFLCNDSVKVTNTSGEMFLTWSQPDSVDDFYTPPFRYQLFRANNNAVPNTLISTQNWNDTTYTDIGLNTVIRGYNYKVNVIDANGKEVLLSASSKNVSSSIYLSTFGTNGSIDLTWELYPAWQNTYFEIYRSDNGGAFTFVQNVPATGANTYTWQDTGLDTEIEYCYLVRSYGSHNVAGIKPNLINDSNQDCAFARDNTPPCNPSFSVTGDCITGTSSLLIDKPEDACDDRTATITILYSPSNVVGFLPILTLDYSLFATDTTIIIPNPNNSNAGCYQVQATNIYGVSAEPSLPFCVDFCPAFDLPNVFSPNGDGAHDFFVPLIYRDVLLSKIEIYDRWGVNVHTQSGNIGNLWDGKVPNGKDAPTGVYYYYIEYIEQRLAGNQTANRKGWIMLMR